MTRVASREKRRQGLRIPAVSSATLFVWSVHVSPPATRVPWSHDELVVACGLYFALPFGQMHSRNHKIIEASRLLGRTPSSLAMKLVNFASLDPAHQARGVKGLSAHSRSDEQVWREFQARWDEMTVLSETRIQHLEAAAELSGPEDLNRCAEDDTPDLPTEAMANACPPWRSWRIAQLSCFVL